MFNSLIADKDEIVENYRLCIDAVTDDSEYCRQLGDLNNGCGEVQTLIRSLLMTYSRQDTADDINASKKTSVTMKIPSFFMGKIIVTLFPFTDIPSGMKPSTTKSSVLTRHPGSALNSRKVPKMPCFCGFYGVGSNEPVDEPSGFKRRGKIKLYQRRSYYA